MSAVSTADPELFRALEGCVTALRRMAEYELPDSLAARMHELGENKEFLSESERGELMALVDLWRERTLEKLEAQVALKRLREHCPALVNLQ